MAKNYQKFLILFVLILGLLIPHSALAFVDALGRIISNFLFANIIRLVLAVSGWVLNIASVILNWVLSEDFIQYSYTDPTRNPIIDIGWTLMKDLVNMFFVIGLSFIGLATALKLKEYNVQKALPRLIIIAFLVNFTPVICGLIVDASNIITYFFIEQSAGLDLLRTQYASQTAVIRSLVKGWFDWEAVISSVLQGFIMAGANIVSAMILLVFALLFAARYIAIWIAVILSPLAFFSYIFPTLPIIGGFWKKWWELFLQWCFIGVMAAFFLYLGNHIMIMAPDMIQAAPPTGDILQGTNPWNTFLQAVLPFGIGIGFLVFGLMQAISGSAMGAQYAFSAARMVGGAATKVTGKGVDLVRDKAPDKIKEGLTAMSQFRTPLQATQAEKDRGAMGWLTRAPKAVIRGAIATPAAMGIRAIGSTFKPGARAGELDKYRKDVESIKTADGFKTAFEGTLNKDKRTVILQEIAKKRLQGKVKIKEEDIIATGQAALAISPEEFKPIADAYPGLVPEMIKFASQKTREKLELDDTSLEKFATKFAEKLEGIKIPGIEDPIARMEKLISMKITSGLSPEDIKNIKIDEIDFDAIHAFWGATQVAAAGREFGQEFVDVYMEGREADAEKGISAVEGANKKGLEWFLERGSSAPLYLASGGAQSLGYTPIQDEDGKYVETKELKERIRLTQLAKRTKIGAGAAGAAGAVPGAGPGTTAAPATPLSEIKQLEKELRTIETTPGWDKSPAQMRERRRIRGEIKSITKENEKKSKQERANKSKYRKEFRAMDDMQRASALESMAEELEQLKISIDQAPDEEKEIRRKNVQPTLTQLGSRQEVLEEVIAQKNQPTRRDRAAQRVQNIGGKLRRKPPGTTTPQDVVTPEMRTGLHKLGYSNAEINDMAVDGAKKIIADQTPFEP